MADKFQFPTDLTRRERWMFEKYAGCTMAKFLSVVGDEATHDEITVEMEAALLLIAARRDRGQTVTFDNVLDSDWELLPPEADEDAGDSPLPPPPNATPETSETSDLTS